MRMVVGGEVCLVRRRKAMVDCEAARVVVW